MLSIPAAKIDPLLVQISKTPISTENVVLFQKLTVIITDIAVLFGAAFISKVKIKGFRSFHPAFWYFRP